MTRPEKRYSVTIDFAMHEAGRLEQPPACSNHLQYHGLDMEQVLVIEEKLIEFLKSLNDYGKEELAAKRGCN